MAEILNARTRPKAVIDPNMPNAVAVTDRSGVVFTVTATAAHELAVELSERATQAHGQGTSDPYGFPECERDLATARAELTEAREALAVQGDVATLRTDLAANKRAVTRLTKNNEALQEENTKAKSENQQLTDAVHAMSKDLSETQVDLRAARRTIDWVKRFAEAHDADQKPQVWLHALTIDIPEACEQ